MFQVAKLQLRQPPSGYEFSVAVWRGAEGIGDLVALSCRKS